MIKRILLMCTGGREVKIGHWLDNQRKHKKTNTLTKVREELLQALVDQGKLVWEFHSHSKRDWNFMYDLLLDYGRRRGTCDVPMRWKERVTPDGDDINLGVWLQNQRITRETTMSPEHRERLQSLVDRGLLHWRKVSGGEGYLCPLLLS